MTPPTATTTSPIGPATAIRAPEHIDERRGPLLARLPLDPLLTLAVIGLGVCSVVTLNVATRHLIAGQPRYYVNRQILYLIAGVVGMVALSRIDYSRWRHLKYGIYVVLILSILAVFGLGHAANGAQRAISLPFFSFQASEL